MDYLIGAEWPLWVLGVIALVVVVDEIWFRWERRNVALANRHHIVKYAPPEFAEDDELCVISNDTDEVVFEGSPAAAYDWVQIYHRSESLDVYNVSTGKRVSRAAFMFKYVE